MTRLIDADALIKDLEYDVELDARTLDDTDLLLGRNRELVQFDKDCKQNAVDMLKKASTVDAIPIEWINHYMDTNLTKVSLFYSCMSEFVRDWQKEQEEQNETD